MDKEHKALEKLSQMTGKWLSDKNWKLVTAESCTGGMVAEVLTSIAGSSKYFECGFVTYSNESKINLLGVNPKTIAKYGAVSEQAACEMVEGALKRCFAQVGLAITGIAGPDGGTADKPVGTVYFAWKCCGQPTKITCQHFSGNRNTVRQLATRYAFENLVEL